MDWMGGKKAKEKEKRKTQIEISEGAGHTLSSQLAPSRAFATDNILTLAFSVVTIDSRCASYSLLVALAHAFDVVACRTKSTDSFVNTPCCEDKFLPCTTTGSTGVYLLKLNFDAN